MGSGVWSNAVLSGLRATRATLDSTWKVLASRVTEPQLDELTDKLALAIAEILAEK